MLEVGALLFVTFVGFALASPAPSAAIVPPASAGGALGLAIVFILFTYGGWNEAAYLSRDVHDVRRNMVRDPGGRHGDRDGALPADQPRLPARARPRGHPQERRRSPPT